MAANDMKVWTRLKQGSDYRNSDCDCDCDCDCSIVPLTIENACSLISTVDFADLRGKELSIAENLIYGSLDEITGYAFNPNGSFGVIILSKKLKQIFDHIRDLQPNIQTTDLSKDIEDAISLLYSLGLIVNRASVPPTRFAQADYFSVWLHLTNACNLDCTYCYINKSKRFMSLDIGIKAIDRIIELVKEQKFKNVKIKYAGGEPAINFDVLESLQRYAIEKCNSENIHLDSVLLTNGVLITEKIISILKELNIRVMVSLDAIDPRYDLRVNSQGKVFTHRVIDSLEMLAKNEVNFEVSITVSSGNIKSLPSTVQFLIENGYRFNLNYYRNHTENQASNERLTNKELTLGILEAIDKAEQLLPKRSIINSFIDKASFSAPHTKTCGAGQNYVVIDCDGSISLCQMKMEDKIGTVNSGNILKLVSMNNHVFKSVEEKEGCKTCEWKYWCAGGCPILALREFGRSDIKSPYCDVYKSIYPQVIKIEAMILNRFKNEMTFEYPSAKESFDNGQLY